MYVNTDNVAALRLYMRCGFVPIRLEKGPLRKEPEKAVKYNSQLQLQLELELEDSFHLSLENMRQDELFTISNSGRCDGDSSRDNYIGNNNAFINAWKLSQDLSINLSDDLAQNLNLYDRVLLCKDLTKINPYC